MKMRVLVACEFSGIVREEFKRLGHDAWSCDLLPTEIEGNHIQGDVLEILDDGWDLMIGHPPCRYMANSGVRWLVSKGKLINPERWKQVHLAAKFFNRLKHTTIPRICLENPIPHKYAREGYVIDATFKNDDDESFRSAGIGMYDQIIQPWQFGHGEQKATCLWLQGLPKLIPTNIVSGREQRVWKAPPKKDRWKERSRTLKGIATAFAEQWGAEG